MTAAASTHTTELIPLAECRPHPANRKRFNQAQLEELAKSLQTSGQITPAIVRPTTNPKDRPSITYEILAGERRWRAAKIAGLPTLVAIVRELDDQQALEIVALENGQREDLDPIDEADLYKAMLTLDGYSVPKIAERLKRSETYVKDRLRLLRLIEPARKLVIDGTIPAQHAVLLAGLQPEEQKRAIAEPEEGGYRVGGLFRMEHTIFDEKDTRVPVSVAEFRDWIRREVRLDPRAEVAGELFPETVAAVQEADATKMKVLALTTDYRVSDAAKDPKVRTIGHEHWKRADGKKGSKSCQYAELGVVVAGEAQGEGFKVCARKDKCAVHWGAEVRAAAKRAKEREAAPVAGKPAKPAKREETWQEQKKREDAKWLVLEEDRKAILAEIEAQGIPTLAELLPRVLAELLSDTTSTVKDLIWNRLKRKLSGWDIEKHAEAVVGWSPEEIQKGLFFALIGDDMEPHYDNGTEHLYQIASAVGLDPKKMIKDREAARRDQEKAAAKAAAEKAKEKKGPAAPAPAKPRKKLAGDVRRANAAKKSERGVPRAKRKVTPAFMALMHPTPALAKVIGDAPVTRVDATKLLWGYIKTHGCQDTKKPRLINGDAALMPLFDGKPQVSMLELSQLMAKNLTAKAVAPKGKATPSADAELSWTDTGWMDPDAPRVEPKGLAAVAKKAAAK